MTDREPFSPEEQRALDAWVVAPAPHDAASRALDASTPRRQSSLARLRAFAAAALILIALAATLLFALGGKGSQGSRQVTTRETLRLGARGVAVAEAGAELSWRVARGGDAELVQKRGSIFYRVEPGGPFRVKTPRGEVTVLGTCFRVEVRPMKSIYSGGAGAAMGAALTSLVFVTVYEGKVRTATAGQGATDVEAGEVARMDGRSKPELVPADGRRATAAAGAARAIRDSRGPTSGPVTATATALRRQVDTLRGEVEQLRGELARAQGKAEKEKVIDLSPSELQAMAKRCELRWDMPSLSSSEPQGIPSKQREQLGLTQPEIDSIKEVLTKTHHEVVATLQRLYVEVTGDKAGASSLSPQALMSEISGKSPPDELKIVYQRLSRERAGLTSPRADLDAASPFERMMRLLTTLGDQVEKRMGAVVGPDLAHRYRRANNGFGSRSRSSYGCPKP